MDPNVVPTYDRYGGVDKPQDNHQYQHRALLPRKRIYPQTRENYPTKVRKVLELYVRDIPAELTRRRTSRTV